MKILFYDLTAPLPYTDLTLQQQALRGTEASIVRVAHGLQNQHDVFVAQQCRATMDNIQREKVNYISLETAHDLNPDVTILVRDYRGLAQMGKQFPRAHHYFWLHNLPAKKLYDVSDVLTKYQYTIISVSHFHRKLIEKRLAIKWYHRIFGNRQANIPVITIYNPIDDELKKDGTVINPTQMIFTSSAYKGLDLTLEAFTQLRKKFPEYRLLVICPDSLSKNLVMPEQVTLINALPPHQLIQYIRESFCVFYPQTQRVETFGFVYAEANAVGTPVLAHDFGAASEVLSNATQLVNGNHSAEIINKITEWRIQRPLVELKEEFRLKNVIKEWNDCLQSS